MTLKEKDIEEPERSVFRVFEFATEAIGWLLIVASPLLVGLAIGVIVYLFNQSAKGLVIGIIITLAGLIVGLVWATKQWKGKGTMWFLSRITATPELDNPDDTEK